MVQACSFTLFIAVKMSSQQRSSKDKPRSLKCIDHFCLPFDLPSQYAEEVETHILDLPDPRETMPRSPTSVLGLDDKKGQQELRPRGPSSMLPLSSHIKDAFDKFEHDFLALMY